MSIKKQAAESLSRLKDYLRRDTHAVDLLGSVERFIGELRKERAAMKADVESLMLRCDTAMRSRDAHVAETDALRRRVTELESQNRHLISEAERARADAVEVRRQYEPDEDGMPCIVNIHCRELFSLVRKLRKLLPKAPGPEAELTDILRGFNGGEYMKLGMFVTFCCLLTGKFSIEHRGLKYRDIAEGIVVSDNSLRHVVHYVRSWIAASPSHKEKLYEAIELAKRDAKAKELEQTARNLPRGQRVSTRY